MKRSKACQLWREFFAWKISKEDNERFWNRFFISENLDEYLKEMRKLEERFKRYKKMYEIEMIEMSKLGVEDYLKLHALSRSVRHWQERIKEVEEAMLIRQREYRRAMRLE